MHSTKECVDVMDKKDKVIQLLKKNSDGLTIIEIANQLKISRNTVPVILAELKGAKLIRIRPVGKAKLHYWEGKR
jgi:Mn-dependent DtxR family transcriptional regulator